jgi:hypothetical protein
MKNNKNTETKAQKYPILDVAKATNPIINTSDRIPLMII